MRLGRGSSSGENGFSLPTLQLRRPRFHRPQYHQYTISTMSTMSTISGLGTYYYQPLPTKCRGHDASRKKITWSLKSHACHILWLAELPQDAESRCRRVHTGTTITDCIQLHPTTIQHVNLVRRLPTRQNRSRGRVHTAPTISNYVRQDVLSYVVVSRCSGVHQL